MHIHLAYLLVPLLLKSRLGDGQGGQDMMWRQRPHWPQSSAPWDTAATRLKEQRSMQGRICGLARQLLLCRYRGYVLRCWWSNCEDSAFFGYEHMVNRHSLHIVPCTDMLMLQRAEAHIPLSTACLSRCTSTMLLVLKQAIMQPGGVLGTEVQSMTDVVSLCTMIKFRPFNVAVTVDDTGVGMFSA